MVGVDVSGASTSVLQLPTLVGTTATLTLKRIRGVLNISAGLNSGWTVYYDSDCVLNWVGGYKGTLALPTGTPKIDALSIVTNNTALVANIKASSGIGMHVCNFNPITSNWASSTSYAVDQLVYYLGALFLCTVAHISTTTFDTTKFVNTNLGGIAQGDIFYKAGSYTNAIFYPFALAPSAINVVSIGSYTKGQTSWQIAGSSVWGSITGLISSQTDLQNALNAKQNSLAITPSTSNAHQVVRIKPDGTGYETANNVPTSTPPHLPPPAFHRGYFSVEFQTLRKPKRKPKRTP